MDFVGPLPPTVRTFNAITVFVDKLTKPAHFLSPAPLPPQLSTSPTTFFFDTFFFFKLHGLSQMSIISDRDKRLTSRFWQELHKLLDVKLALSICLPPTDGWTNGGYEQDVEDDVTGFH